MDLTISGIKDQLTVGYQYIAEKVGVLAGHTVKMLKISLDAIQQDARLACATIAVANVLFFQIAWLVAIVTDYVLTKTVGADAELKESTISFKNIVILASATSSLVAMNVGLAKGLKLNLNPLTVTLVSSGSCVLNFTYYLWRSSKQDATEKTA